MRLEKGLTQKELAQKSGIKQPLISAYENESAHAKFPSLRNLIALARALNCTLEQLTGLESLKGVEQEIETDLPSEQARTVADAFDRLPEGDIRRQLIEQILLGLKKDVNHMNKTDQEAG